MEKRTKIIIVRHGECPGNIEGRVRGRTEFPLNENGIKQAEAVAEALKNEAIECIYTSPLSRAKKTAEIIAEKGGFKVKADARFDNMFFGPWEGRKKDDLAKEFPEDWNTWLTSPENLHVPGAETFDEVQARAMAGINDLLLPHKGGTFAIVSHRGLIKPMIAGILGMQKPSFWKIYVDNASLSVLTHTDLHGFTLMELNNTCHLKGLSLVQEFI